MSAQTGAILKAYRLDFGLTQQQFAERLGISRSALTQLEAGKTKPSYEVMDRLLEEFSVDPTVFFDKGDNASVERRTMADVNRVTDFWYEVYRDNFQKKDVLQELMYLEKLIDREEYKSALRNIYSLYSSLSSVVDELDLNFIDALKRCTLPLSELRSVPFAERDTEHFRLEVKRMKNRLTALGDSASRYWMLKGKMYAGLMDPLGSNDTEKFHLFFDDKHNLMKYSQEKYLYAFFTLLDHSEALADVKKFYERKDAGNER